MLVRLREQAVDRALRLHVRLAAGCKHLVRLVLRGLHVGLVERVDLEIRAGDRDGELPAEELAAERVRVGDLRPRRLPIVAVRGLARRRDETLALLAGRLRDQLLCPEPEPSVLLLDADLVAAFAPPVSEPATQLVARVAVVAPACIGHPCRTVEQACDVDAHQRRRDDSERGKGGVAAADRRLTGKDVAKAALAGGALEVRARVGDRDERRAPPAGELPEVVGVRSRLERAAGLRRGDEERPLELDRLLELTDRLRMGRVEHVEALYPERPPQHLGREARAAHSEQDDGVEPLLVDCVGERLELPGPLRHPARLVEPAQPLRLVGAAPDGRVALPDPVDQLCPVANAHAAASAPRFARTPSSSSANESANFCTPSSSSVSVTSS